ncbi:uncharacterized protein CTRU02_215384 [Colletotrichum truncatum]|uniref:Uncharacterized protein n=1 Tax=Colletotrichum truncatum TaxID=5467 RepID=A0ACC3YD14_COLTU
MMKSQVLSSEAPLAPDMVREAASSGAFSEVPNGMDSVRHHIFWFGMRDKETGKTQKSIMFAIYQSGKHGPQNGYRLCLVHQGFYIASAERVEGEPEDDIDRLEKDIPLGHQEMVILGEPIAWEDTEGCETD